MKQIDSYITEKLRINRDTSIQRYHPKDKAELMRLIGHLLRQGGGNADLNCIDVSEITDMSYLFLRQDPYKIDISSWDTSNVTNMARMFSDCLHLECDLSNLNK